MYWNGNGRSDNGDVDAKRGDQIRCHAFDPFLWYDDEVRLTSFERFRNRLDWGARFLPRLAIQRRGDYDLVLCHEDACCVGTLVM